MFRTKLSNEINKIENSRIKLSTREKEVLILLAYENTNSEIATKLFLSEGTIATYRSKLLAKYSVKNTAGIIRKAFEEMHLVLEKHNK